MTRNRNDIEQDLLELARALPREEDPPPGAWGEIEARITHDVRARASAAGVHRQQWWLRPPLLAAAAVLLMATSSAVTATLLRRDSQPRDGLRGGIVHEAPQSALTLAAFAERENDYLDHVNTLLAALEDESSGLAPETIATIRANLLVIDAAIIETRRALAGDPANRRLVEILASTYEKKLDLLRRTTAMARSG